MLRKVKSCGVLVFRREPVLEFLVMKHPHRFDLPKGHVEEGETEIQCALREMWEETGIPMDAIELDPQFRFQEVYYPREARYPTERVEKTLVIFLGMLDRDMPITVTEHAGHEWLRWNPPHAIQRLTIDPVLAAVHTHWSNAG